MNDDKYRLRFAETNLTTGVRLHYAQRGNPAGYPIILLHGFTDSWFSFSRALPLLPPSYRVYALDQRGHGDSERPVSGYAMRDLVADVLAFMDAKGLAWATLVGHRMGSFVAQQVALAATDRVARLILVESAINLRDDVILEFQRAVDSLHDLVPADFAREFRTSTAYQAPSFDFMKREVSESLKLPASVWRAVLAGQLAAESATRLSESRIPTLLLWGDRDAVFPRSEQDALRSMIPSATLKVYPRTGHAVQWERPATFCRDIVDFITRTEPQLMARDAESRATCSA